jgi:invasion protein IalB
MMTVAAPRQWRQLHDNGGGSTRMAAARQQFGGSSTSIAAAPRRWQRLHDDGGGSRWRQLHTDWMVVCLKQDGCCFYCALSEQLNCLYDFLYY